MAKADVMTLVVKLEASEFHRQMGLVETKAKKTFGGVTRHSKGATGAIEGVRVGVSRMRNNFLLFNFTIGATIFAMAKMAERMQTVTNLERGFATLNSRIGASPDFLNKLTVATGGLVSEMELMKSANNAIILGVAKSQDEFLELARGATILGQAVGLEAQPALESLVTGIGRQSRLMLDNLGIIVRVDEAYRSYAKTLGVSKDSLNDLQKKQAFQIDALAKVKAASDGLAIAQNTMAQDFKSGTITVLGQVDAMLSWLNTRVKISRGLGALPFPSITLDTAGANQNEASQKVFTAFLGGQTITSDRRKLLVDFAKNAVDILSEETIKALNQARTNEDILKFFAVPDGNLKDLLSVAGNKLEPFALGQFSTEFKAFVDLLVEGTKAEQAFADKAALAADRATEWAKALRTGNFQAFEDFVDNQKINANADAIGAISLEISNLTRDGNIEGVAALKRELQALQNLDLNLFKKNYLDIISDNDFERFKAVLTAGGVGNGPNPVDEGLTNQQILDGQTARQQKVTDPRAVVGGPFSFNLSGIPIQESKEGLKEIGLIMGDVEMTTNRFGDLLRILGVQDMPALQLEAERVGEAFRLLEESGMEFTNPARYEDIRAILVEMGFELEGMGEKVKNFNFDMERSKRSTEAFLKLLRSEGIRAAQTFSDALIDGAFGAEIAWDRFFKQLMSDLLKAIARAAILKALSFGGGGGGIPNSKGSIVGENTPADYARGGFVVSGGVPGRDSVNIRAQQGEAVLPVGLTQFLVASARNAQRETNQTGDTEATASVVNLTIHAPAGTPVDGESVREMLLGNPDIVGEAVRNADRVGAL